MTEADVLQALKVEQQTLNRKHIIEQLISRAVELYRNRLYAGN